MPVNLIAPDPALLFPVPGIELGIAMAGVRKAMRRDLTVVTMVEGSSVAGVFTGNRFCAAPVQLCRKHLAASTAPRAILPMAESLSFPGDLAECHRLMAQQQAEQQQQRYTDREQVLEGGFTNCWKSHWPSWSRSWTRNEQSPDGQRRERFS